MKTMNTTKYTKHGRGRPPIDPEDPSTNITVRVTTKIAEAVRKYAIKEGITISKWIRDAIERKINQ